MPEVYPEVFPEGKDFPEHTTRYHMPREIIQSVVGTPARELIQADSSFESLYSLLPSISISSGKYVAQSFCHELVQCASAPGLLQSSTHDVLES